MADRHETDQYTINQRGEQKLYRNIMKNILAFGDSIIKGISYQNNRYHQNPERFTALLEERWNIHIENKGQMGSTVLRLPKAVERSESYLKDPEYDTVFLLYGGNDCDFDWQAISEAPSDTHICKTAPDQFPHEYINGINKLKDCGKEIYLLSLPPIDADKYFGFITKGRDGEAIRSWLHGDISLLMHWHEMYNLAVFQIGQTTGVPVLDISSCFLSRPNYTRFLCDDGIHPNSEGHRLMADAIASQFSINA